MKRFETKNLRDSRKMETGEYCFQGDVIIKKIDAIPDIENSANDSKNILAEGEATGHMHQVIGNSRVIKNTEDTSEVYLEVLEDSNVCHQEHSPIKIGPGFYKIEIQKEYNHFTNLIDLVYD